MPLNDDNYKFTEDDVFALNEMFFMTHSFTLRGSGERQIPRQHKQFFINAPGRANVWYTGDGHSVSEAVDNWWERVAKGSGARLRRLPKPNKEDENGQSTTG